MHCATLSSPVAASALHASAVTPSGYCVPMEETSRVAELDAHLPRPVRTYLEDRYWRPIEAQASLEALCLDPAFLADPGTHPAMFADHGVVHVRDAICPRARWPGLTRVAMMS